MCGGGDGLREGCAARRWVDHDRDHDHDHDRDHDLDLDLDPHPAMSRRDDSRRDHLLS
jgi:hypothetical protein